MRAEKLASVIDSAKSIQAYAQEVTQDIKKIKCFTITSEESIRNAIAAARIANHQYLISRQGMVTDDEKKEIDEIETLIYFIARMEVAANENKNMNLNRAQDEFTF